MTDKDLYTAILGVLQSHLDSELFRSASQAEVNDGAVAVPVDQKISAG